MNPAILHCVSPASGTILIKGIKSSPRVFIRLWKQTNFNSTVVPSLHTGYFSPFVRRMMHPWSTIAINFMAPRATDDSFYLPIYSAGSMAQRRRLLNYGSLRLSHRRENRYRFGERLIWVLKEATSVREKVVAVSMFWKVFYGGRDFKRLSFEGLQIFTLNAGRYNRKSVACKEWSGKWKTNDDTRSVGICEGCFLMS